MAQQMDAEVFAGDNVTLPLAARDRSNNPVNLTGLTVTWGLAYGPFTPDCRVAILTKTGTVTSASGGLYTVAVLPNDTSGLPDGNYTHQAYTTDTSGNVATVTFGTFRVRRYISPGL